MSLLIKALHKAEQQKASEDKSITSAGGLAFELAPKDNVINESMGFESPQPINKPSQQSTDTQPRQKAAAGVFAAKTSDTDASTKTLIVTGIVLLFIVAAGFYYYLESLNRPELVVPARVVGSMPTPESSLSSTSQEPMMETDALSATEAAIGNILVEESVFLEDAVEKPPIDEGFSLNPTPSRSAATNSAVAYGEPPAKPADAGVKVTRNNPPPAINPNLNSAYAAFNAGDDATAQASYRQVLQTDIRNTDALLGMAAIAMRQGRNNDALGWYGKVLEVEPRNSFAQAAMASLVGQIDPVSSESRIKNLIAIQPNAAHLHAALGNLYAEQNQWSQAQQSYFEAHRMDASNAEHAFNLAVSLDQLGKPALALQYYKEALTLLSRNSTVNINRTTLESRIAQLQ